MCKATCTQCDVLYSGHLNNTGSNMGPFTRGLVSINMQSAFRIPGFRPWIQPSVDQNQSFQSVVDLRHFI